MHTSNRITREAPSQRRNYRIQSPIKILIKGKKYTTSNWSVGGFSVFEFKEFIPTSEKIEINLSISFNHFNINFYTNAIVMRIDSDKHCLACQFINLDDPQKALLNHFANALLQGEMSTIDETIKRLDIPVTLVSENPDASANKVPIKRRKLKPIIIGGSYLFIGALLFIYTLNSIYSNIYTLKIENAAIRGLERVVKAPHAGTIQEIYQNPGDLIKFNDPLIFVQNDQIVESAELAHINVLSANVNLQEMKNRLHAQQEKIDSYREFGFDKLNIAKAITISIEQKIDLTKKRKQRLINLHKNGMTSDESIDDIKEKIITLNADLIVARAKQKISERAIQETKRGRFYTDNRLEGEVTELIFSIESAKEKVKLEKQKYQLLKNRESRLTVTAPSEGKIVSLYSNQQQIVTKGEPLLLISLGGEREIEAFISANELATVVLNKPAKILVGGNFLQAKVIKIENTSFQESRNLSISNQHKSDNLVRVILQFSAEIDKQYIASQPIGLPVLVEFSKRNFTDDFPQFKDISNFVFSMVNADEKHIE
ncbi:MAG: HlyD family efflux transporter periplasmic adaptor subunit [Ectothiorhodospiraceae bacterium]|nr:HlyD family efflux transporter periplasmic adaptor subunit [Ectothiorhodospiraceae bacterium]